MKYRKPIIRIFLTLTCLFYSCKNHKTATGTEDSATGSVTFVTSPVPYSAIRQATPLGNLNPPGHTFPTDHIYFYLNGLDLVEVRAHVVGTIQEIRFNAWSSDYRITFKHTEKVHSYLDHVKNLFPGIEEGAHVMPGDSIGYGDPTVSAVDLGVVDYDTTRYFINRARYHNGTLHCGDPYRYFTDTVREELLAKNPRTVEPRGGKIDFDIDGALSGNWFLQGTPVNQSTDITYSSNHLAFVYDMFNPTEIRISCGGTLDMAPFNYSVKGNAPDPATITQASGLVKYEFPSWHQGVLLVQLLDARTIKVEDFPEKTNAQVSDFTAAAKTYVR